jgi:hypothetical protein
VNAGRRLPGQRRPFSRPLSRTWACRSMISGPLQLNKPCVPHTEKQGYGRIAFCFSIALLQVSSFVCYIYQDLRQRNVLAATRGVLGPHYSSKVAIHGIVHCVARQYSKKVIVSKHRYHRSPDIASPTCLPWQTCNAIAPALIANAVMFKDPTSAHRVRMADLLGLI